MKLLAVGDVHAVAEELDDCQALIDYVTKVAVDNEAEVLFLGDQYNSHSVIRAEVLWFWRNAFKKLGLAGVQTTVLVGNHDQSGAGSEIHAMAAHEDQVTVVDRPQLRDGVLMLPYYNTTEEFFDACTHGGKTLICHATFDGSKFDNGFYAPDGIDLDQVPQENVISGHIHMPQVLGKLQYVGAPRWRTLSDANLDRAIWLYSFASDGTILSATPFSTNDVCRRIFSLKDTEESPIESAFDAKHDYRIDISGTAEYVERRKKELSGPGRKVRTFKTETITHAVRESEGIPKAFRGYLAKYSPKYGTPTEVLASMAHERLGL